MTSNHAESRLDALVAATKSGKAYAATKSANVDVSKESVKVNVFVARAPTFKRLLLAWTLDFYFFGAVYGIAFIYLVGSLPALIYTLVPFVLIELVFVKLRVTLGYRTLSLYDSAGSLVVDPFLKRRESLPIMIFATFLFWLGTTTMVQSMESGLSAPYYGFSIDPPLAQVLDIATGGFMILVAYHVFRMTRLGLILVLVGSVLMALDAYLSLSLVQEYIREYAAIKNQTRVNEVPPGYIDFMARVISIFVWVGCGISIFLVLFYSECFVSSRRSAEEQPDPL